jgi:hypothetical protein
MKWIKDSEGQLVNLSHVMKIYISLSIGAGVYKIYADMITLEKRELKMFSGDNSKKECLEYLDKIYENIG